MKDHYLLPNHLDQANISGQSSKAEGQSHVIFITLFSRMYWLGFGVCIVAASVSKQSQNAGPKPV